MNPEISQPEGPNTPQNQQPEPPTYGPHPAPAPPAPPNTKRKLPGTTKIRRFFLHIKNWWLGLKLWQKILVGLIALALLAGVGFGVYKLTNKPQPVQTPKSTTKTVPKPTTVASPLSGLQVAPNLAKRPVTGIMIENSTDARPQSGLQAAGVVVEAIAEGGITRFLSLFQDTTPQYIGPVRSLRPYYIDFAQAFQASIAHVGGSPDALSRVRNGNYRDLDQFFNAGAFNRVTTRAAPHNVFTSFDNLDKLNQSKGYSSSSFVSWPRKSDAILAVPTARTIDLNISSFYFNVHYAYDTATNSYLRSEGGAAHMNLVSSADKTGVQLAPKVVIALVMSYAINPDGQHSNYTDTGTGNAYIYQDGGVTVGKWTRASAESQITFTDTAGAPIKLNAGQTWLSLVASDGAVVYAP